MKKVRIGSVGLGRLGYEHAKNIASMIPNAELGALCDVDEANLKKVANELGVSNIYIDFEKMCRRPDLDAIVIVSPSSLHPEQIKIAMENGKHVFCEKPLGVTVEACKDAEATVEAHPDLKFMLGFMRRFDPSYMNAKKRIENGDLGRIILIRGYSVDPISSIENTIAYGPHSGGQFLDMAVHDIDLIRWLTGSEPDRIWALGGCYEFEEFASWNDGDNVSCTMQLKDDTMAFIFAGRAAPHGSHVETEIIGTKGAIRISPVPTPDLNVYYDEHGVRQEAYQDFMMRWQQAYINEITEFCDCIIEDRTPPVSVYDGTATTRIAYRCKESFESGSKLLSMD
ncbi:MAG: Gfo/Idh/MocA family oxidoreductase [Clostridiaceae bacterium]|nr:Gfo/Idh/MocA family oxidoreductase [Clostridiaceae bacterium]